MSVIDTSKLSNGNIFVVAAMNPENSFRSYLDEVLPEGFTYITGCGKVPHDTGLDGKTLYQYRLMNKSTRESFFITEEHYNTPRKNEDGTEMTDKDGNPVTIDIRRMVLKYEEWAEVSMWACPCI